jgi:hypothetical protein
VRRLISIALFAFVSAAHATVWEYATLREFKYSPESKITYAFESSVGVKEAATADVPNGLGCKEKRNRDKYTALQQILDCFGNQQWELITMIKEPDSYTEFLYIFKRPKK